MAFFISVGQEIVPPDAFHAASAYIHNKTKIHFSPKELSGCYANHLHQAFHQKAPNLVWTSDFTFCKAGGKWYYLCIIMDLFLEKLSLGIYHPDPMRSGNQTAFRKHIIPEIVLLD